MRNLDLVALHSDIRETFRRRLTKRSKKGQEVEMAHHGGDVET